jgi:tetratricopeptide (TPR) repeat protein
MLHAIELDPQDPIAHLALGEVYRQKRLWRLAEAEFRVTTQLAPKLTEADLELAAVEIELQDPPDALAVLEASRERMWDSPRVLLEAGDLYLTLTRPDRARAVAQRAVALLPSSAEARFLLGRAELAQGEFPAAVQAFLAAVRLDPKFAEAYNYLGYLHVERKLKLDQAVRWIQRALVLEPQNGNYHDSLGWAYFQLGQYERALPELRAAITDLTQRHEPVDREIQLHLGETLIKLGRPDEALALWREAFRQAPQDQVLRERVEQLERAAQPKP